MYAKGIIPTKLMRVGIWNVPIIDLGPIKFNAMMFILWNILEVMIYCT